MPSRRILPALVGAIVAVALLPVPADAQVGAVPAPTLAAGARERVVPALTEAGERVARAAAAQRARRIAHARTLELRRLRHSRTVGAALRRLWLAGSVDRAHYLAARRTLWQARRTAARLPAARARELRAALAVPAGLAARRLLTSSRLPLVVLTVARNTRFWAQRPWPAAGQRIRFGRDPVVFRWEPGQGLQVHMLSTAGLINGWARDCLYRPVGCNRLRLRGALRRLTQLAARRGGFLAWESLYRWGSGTPPWVSAMTQGTAIQALARGGRALHERHWLLTGRRALGAFEQAPPVGVAVPARRGRSYLMYSFAPRMQILNGFLQSITGLRDLAVLSGSSRARRLWRRGDRAARAELPAFDTGAWSLYSLGGPESPLGYHQLTAAFLRNLCRRTDAHAYCGAARRYARYEREPPRIAVRLSRRPRVRRPVTIAFALSKVSDVRIAVAGPRGTGVLRRARYVRGTHRVVWQPPASGRYRVQVVAAGLSGPHALAVRDLTVRPRKVHRRKPRA